MKKNIFIRILLIVTLLGIFPGQAAARTAGWTMTDLGTLGGKFSVAILINEKGQVAGNSETVAGEIHGFFWDDGQMIDLGTLGGTQSTVVDLNNNGQIVGDSFTESQGEHVFLWENGVMYDLGFPGRAGGINDQGQITGVYNTPQGGHAFLWQDQVFTDLGSLGGYMMFVNDINEVGQVVGTGAIPEIDDEEWDMMHAFLGSNDTLTDIGTLNNGTHSWGAAVNDLGQVVGNSEHFWYNGQWGFLWQNGQMTDLGTLGGSSAFPIDINNHGQIVGSSATIPLYQASHGFLWENGFMTDLGTLGGVQSFAMDINEGRQIVGTSDTAEGTGRAFLWESGVIRDLGALEGLCCSGAAEINEQGQVVGSSYDDPQTETSRATLWTKSTQISIRIDIKPGSSTNPINLKSKGVVPVAALTADEFKATDLDPKTVIFAGAAPVKWFKTDVDSDGDLDMLFHFPVKKLNLTRSSTQASLTGSTYEGFLVEGMDKVTIVPKK